MARKNRLNATATKDSVGDIEGGAQCVPLAITWLARELVLYADLDEFKKQKKKSEGENNVWDLGFNQDQTMDFLKSIFGPGSVQLLKGYPNDPKKVAERLRGQHLGTCTEESRKLPAETLLVFGNLKCDYQNAAVKKNPKLAAKIYWQHCAAINFRKEKEYYCAYHGNQKMEVGIGFFREIDAILTVKMDTIVIAQEKNIGQQRCARRKRRNLLKEGKEDKELEKLEKKKEKRRKAKKIKRERKLNK